MSATLPVVLSDDHKDLHNKDPAYIRAGQSVIDQNMYVFSAWATRIVKSTPGLKRSQRMLFRAFFMFTRKSLHRAICAETWQYFGELIEKIIALAESKDQNLDELASKLAAPETRKKLQDSLSLTDDQANEITAVEIAKAFRKMFKVEQSGKILREFRDQVAFIEEKLKELGFP